MKLMLSKISWCSALLLVSGRGQRQCSVERVKCNNRRGIRVHGRCHGQGVWYRKGELMCNSMRGVQVSGRCQGQGV